MLTGDNPVVARAVAQRLGLTHHYADMLPVDKAEVIQKLQREGKIVAMVGDGMNDLPALSFADVGIAMKHGAEVTHEFADVVLMEDSLWKLVKAVEISRELSGSYQTELCDRGGHEHLRARTGSSRRVDQPFGYRAGQQWLSHCREFSMACVLFYAPDETACS